MLPKSSGTIVFAIIFLASLCGLASSSLARGGHRGFHGGLYGVLKSGGPVYLVIDIAEVTDPDAVKTMMDKAQAALVGFGGRVIIDSDQATALDGAAPGRFVVFAFDDPEKAKAWTDSTDAKEFNAIRLHAMKSRAFMIAGRPSDILASVPPMHGHRMRFDPKPFEEIVKQRDGMLDRLKNICKGC